MRGKFHVTYLHIS